MKRHLRRVLYATLVIASVTGISAAGASGYWYYNNSQVVLTKLSQPDTTQKIVKDGESTDGVVYDGALEVTSVEQMEDARNDTSQPLYLRNYMSIPGLGINVQIYEGLSDRVLTYGAGTIKPNQSLESFGNYAVAAHNFQDGYWGHGFSTLQTHPDVHGKTAYISDGEYVYSYILVDYDNVYRDESMKFTEDDWRQQMLQDEIKKYAPEEFTDEVTPDYLYNEDNSYVDNTDSKSMVYGKLLTLYTCYLEGWNRTQSWNRILVTGIMTGKTELNKAPSDVQALFIDGSGNMTVTGSEEVPTEAQAQEQAHKDEANIEQSDFRLRAKTNRNDLIKWWDAKVKPNPDFPMTVIYAGMGVFLVSIIGMVILNRLT